MKLTDRLREIAGHKTPGVQPEPVAVAQPRTAAIHDCERVLGGEWTRGIAGGCYVVESVAPAELTHGRHLVRDFARPLTSARQIALLANGSLACPPFVFFDLETTGLSGGAGTLAFLIGCGWFREDGSFVTRQHVLLRPDAERSMLAAAAGDLSRGQTLVSFNGKAFDAPVLETRFLFHRLDWSRGDVPHVDALHLARRFWSTAGGEDARTNNLSELAGESVCSLSALEEHVLGVGRASDVPGVEIPSRYFQFLRTGDARLLAGVLEHNRQDLLSLGGLVARLAHLVNVGPAAAADAGEALGLGRTYLRADRVDEARASFERAARSAVAPRIRLEALRHLARLDRRQRRFDQAARRWRELLEMSPCPDAVAREALEALAVHHEHRIRDLRTAKAYALRSLEGSGVGQGWRESIEFRVARIERKLDASRYYASLLD